MKLTIIEFDIHTKLQVGLFDGFAGTILKMISIELDAYIYNKIDGLDTYSMEIVYINGVENE